MIEANPRSSRSVPFIAKASRVPLVDFGVMAILGKKAKQINLERLDWKKIDKVCVKV